MRRLRTGAVIVLAGALAVLWFGRCNAQRVAPRPGKERAPRAGGRLTPDAYKDLMSQALEDVRTRSMRESRQPVAVALNLFLAHEAWVKGVPQEVLVKTVDAFKEAGADRVDMNPGLFPFRDGDRVHIAKYDAVVERIRHHGMKLGLNPQYSPVAHKLRSFTEWRDAAMELYAELARRYKPDVFVVAHEPSTMSARLGAKSSVRDWVGFVQRAAAVVKEHSPKSRIGAGGLSSEREYYEAFAELPEVEVLTLDIYNLRELPAYGEMVRLAKSKGKGVYIEETWRSPYFEPAPGLTLDTISLKHVGNRKFEALDSEWIRAMTAWAQAMGLEAITPVWMFPLFKYVDGEGNLADPAYNRSVVEAILKGERTSTFRTIQEIAQENKRLAGATRKGR